MGSNRILKRLDRPPIWEWVIAAVGLALVLGVLGVTLYRAVTKEGTPPKLAISDISVEAAGEFFLVKFSVVNTGDTTAAGLTVEGGLKEGDRQIETSTAALTYSPANSTRSAGMFFTKDPKKYMLEIRPVGFETP